MKKVINVLLALLFCCVKMTAQTYYDKMILDNITSYQYYLYADNKINGSDNQNNLLVKGKTVVYLTSEGRYGKFEVQDYAYNLTIRWTTYNKDGTVYSSGSNLTITGTWSCDLDLGKQSQVSADFWWEQITEVERYLTPKNRAAFYPIPESIQSNAQSQAEQPQNPQTSKTKEQRQEENVETGIKIVGGLVDALGKKKTEQAKPSKTQTLESQPVEPQTKGRKEIKNQITEESTTEATFSAAIVWQPPISNGSTSTVQTVELKACVEVPDNVKEYTLIQNGLRLSIPRGVIARKSSDCVNVFIQQVSLKLGENKFQLIATTNAEQLISQPFVIYFDPNAAQLEPKTTVSSEPAKIEKRIALVIGNADYTEGAKLKNPVNDANLMATTLENLGFRVIKANNVNKSSFELAIRDFSAVLGEYNVALFYYAGHGIQVDGENYLLPIDAKLASKSDVRFEAVKVRFAIEEFENHPDNVNIVILDACRNNPFRSWARGGAEGFKPMQIGGTLVAFATQPDATASDGSGSNGLYTEELVKQIQLHQPIEAVFRETRKAVLARSDRAQSPQEWTQLTQAFYFKR